MEYTIGQILENRNDRGRVKVLEVGASTIVLSSGEFTDEVLGLFGFSQVERDYKIIE